MNDAELKALVPRARQLPVRDAYLPDDSIAEPSQYQTLSGLLRVLRQRWRLVGLTALSIAVVGIALYFVIVAYGATTTIEINKDAQSDSAQASDPALSADDIKNEVQTDVSILQTDNALALSVIKKLNLMQAAPFKNKVVASERGRPLEEAPRTRDAVLGLFHGRLKIENPPDTRLITISYKGSDPVQAANITNTVAKTFIESTLDRRQRSILTASGSLRGALADLKKQVEDSEQKLADYERNTGMAGIELTGSANGNGGTSVSITPQNTVTSRLLTLNQELTAAEANRISTQAVNNLVNSHDPEAVLGLGTMSVASGTGGNGSSVTPESIALVSQLRAQETDLERQMASSKVVYGEKNPRTLQLQEQIDALKRQLKAETDRIRSRAANDYRYAQANENSIRAEFKKQQDAANEMADKSVKLQLLAQEAFSNRALYDSLFSKLQTAALSSGTRATRIDVVSEAVPAGTPSVPKMNVYMAGVAGLAILFGVTAAFLRESLDETVHSSNDLGNVQGLFAPGYIPRLSPQAASEISPGGSLLIESPRSPFSESFRALRTTIGMAVSSTRARTVMITSALGGAGKTTITYNLGVAFAQQGARVLLIDGDLRNPDLHRRFGTAVSPGLSEACSNLPPESIPGIVQHASLPTLHMLPAGKELDFPSELFGSTAFEALLRRAAGQYDYVLVDSPPILAVTDASIIATKVNALVAVVRSRNTTRPALNALIQAVQWTQVPTVSFVLNDVRYPSTDGFYDYSYSRSRGDQIDASV